MIQVPRSVKKGPFIHGHLMKKVNATQAASVKRPIKTWSRSSMVLPEMIGLTIAVHNGRDFVPIYINEKMIGHKIGESPITQTFRSNRAADKKAKKKKKKK